MKRLKVLIGILVFAFFGFCLACVEKSNNQTIFTDFTAETNSANIEFFWKDNADEIFKNFQNLKDYTEKRGNKLRFAMNGGMYQTDNKPLGLFIENGKIITGLNTKTGEGNFYLKPNGVFYITEDRRAKIVASENFRDEERIKFATQSGPMLVIEGQINPLFSKDSKKLNIRNGVCVLENSKIVFSISRAEVNFYDFAVHFKDLGCQDALYLDGFVSRIYLPEQNLNDLGGDFGVIIGIVE